MITIFIQIEKVILMINKVSLSNNYNMNNINFCYILEQENNYEKEWKKGKAFSRKLCHYNNERPCRNFKCWNSKVEGQLTPYLFYVSYKKSIWLLANLST